MAATIDATVGGATANSYQTIAEIDAYFESRIALSPPWEETDADTKIRLAITATRVLDSFSRPVREFIVDRTNVSPRIGFYITRRQWTGAAASAVQRLAWPRIGMYDRNGNAIPSNIIPVSLKEAHAELAGQLQIADTTLDNEVLTQGITSLKAGSVALTFRESLQRHIMPSMVFELLVASWMTDELVTLPETAEISLL